jgi:hypothetical protein
MIPGAAGHYETTDELDQAVNGAKNSELGQLRNLVDVASGNLDGQESGASSCP